MNTDHVLPKSVERYNCIPEPRYTTHAVSHLHIGPSHAEKGTVNLSDTFHHKVNSQVRISIFFLSLYFFEGYITE